LTDLSPGPDETLDRLSATLNLLQRRRGHRATSDDVLLAWAGTTLRPGALRVLDLGSGKGTVALLASQRLPAAQIIGLEAFEQSWALAVRNARLNDVQDRYHPRLGDLRASATHLADQAPFDLIMGAPPFMPVGSGVLPQDAQRAAGRFELKGGVAAYAACAARHLAPDGAVVLLMDGHGRDRLQAAFADAGLHLHGLRAVRPRPQRPPTFWIGHGGHQPAEVQHTELNMRAHEGEPWTPDYLRVRQHLNLVF
jgi:tRNA1(Val) A37 N6-methylase TrmN6